MSFMAKVETIKKAFGLPPDMGALQARSVLHVS